MKVWVLGSGSEGNAVLVESGESRVLIDCGFGTRTLLGRLKTIGIAPSLSAVGVKRESIPRLVEIAVADICHQTNPQPVTAKDFERLFAQAM